MKQLFLMLLICLHFSVLRGQNNQYDIFYYKAPNGFTQMGSNGYLHYEKREGKNYCQLFIYPAVTGQSDIEKDFSENWDAFARNAAQNVGDPETKELDSLNGWQMIMGAARGTFNKQMFAITLSTFTKDRISYYIASVFTDKKYIPVAQDFIGSVAPDQSKFVQHVITTKPNEDTRSRSAAGSSSITKSTTNFNDGWLAHASADYVMLSKAGTEVRLHYIDKVLDEAKPNTVDAPEYYWSKYVAPYYDVPAPEKWSGVQYPVIYHIQGNAVEKVTGNHCYAAIKIVYAGGARPVVVITPNKSIYQQQFPHPKDIDPMLNANRFAITANDIVGTWKGGGGGGVEYYNAYSGTYAGMSAVSSTDEFSFNNNGTYSSTYRSASMNNSGAQFGGQDFKGNFSVTDWSITASNRYKGKTTTFKAHLIAVKGGYLLYMEDTDNASMKYTLFKTK